MIKVVGFVLFYFLQVVNGYYFGLLVVVFGSFLVMVFINLVVIVELLEVNELEKFFFEGEVMFGFLLFFQFFLSCFLC